MQTCELCREGGDILYRDERLRVILVDDASYPGFCRVIWNAHVREMTDLAPDDARYLLEWVLKTERAVREVLKPDKVNLASLGNVVPHLHWHVIPRFAADAHFPAPIWAAPERAGQPPAIEGLAVRLREHLAA